MAAYFLLFLDVIAISRAFTKSACDTHKQNPGSSVAMRYHAVRKIFLGGALCRAHIAPKQTCRTTSDKVRMRQMFHVKHGVDAPPTTCMRSPKRKRLRNRCFATATDIHGCSVARSIEVTKVSYHGSSSPEY